MSGEIGLVAKRRGKARRGSAGGGATGFTAATEQHEEAGARGKRDGRRRSGESTGCGDLVMVWGEEETRWTHTVVRRCGGRRRRAKAGAARSFDRSPGLHARAGQLGLGGPGLGQSGL
ncbi:hypothetical protein ZWY2020_052747 [Hordeum vulgare]|nr:hypothetical protein ZWY2020_052747 [Hordeum vulgare]